jgi:hypothetical protein
MSHVRRPDPDPETIGGELAPELQPPADLEERVVAALRAEGALRPVSRRWTTRNLLAAAAVFVAGFAVGAYLSPDASPPEDTRARFLLLLYEGERRPPRSEEDALAREYGAWAAGLRRSGRTVTGDRLASEPRVGVNGADADSLAGALQGFFIVGADSLEEATLLAEESPHVRHGGRVVLRVIDTP